MKHVPKHIEHALIEKMNDVSSAYRDGVTGEIDVEGLVQAALRRLEEEEPKAHSELLEIAPLVLGREVYQHMMRTLRYVARGEAMWRDRTGEEMPDDQQLPAQLAIRKIAPDLLEVFTKRMTAEVLSMQFSYRGDRGRWHRREYGDLTAPEMRILEDKYEAEARSKQATADMIRADRELFEQAQREFFGQAFDDLLPKTTIRDFMRSTVARAS